jgi:DUF4097 and DUF4098 domain-containing protein YvlB
LRGEDFDLTLRSGDGNIEAGLDPGMSLAFTIQTHEGNVRMSGIEVADLRQDKRHTSGLIGGGRGRMKITTGDGDVTLPQE